MQLAELLSKTSTAKVILLTTSLPLFSCFIANKGNVCISQPENDPDV